MKLHVRTDDTVVVISGKDVGKKGKVLATDPSTGMVLVEGVNIVSRHQKPRRQGEAGGIIEREGYIRARRSCAYAPSAQSQHDLLTKSMPMAIRPAYAKNAEQIYREEDEQCTYPA